MVDLKAKSISSVINTCECKIHQQVSIFSISQGVGGRYDYSYNDLQTDETILQEIEQSSTHSKEYFLARMDSINLAETVQYLPSRWEYTFGE